MELKNIAVLGPRGNVGSSIISELLKDGDRFNITTITRTTSTYAVPSSTSINHKKIDYSSLKSMTEAFRGQDAVLNCITGGATQYEPSKLIIDASIAAGVKFFFANEYVGYVTSDQFKRLPEGIAGAKTRIREYLEKLGEEQKIVWTSLNGGPFFDMWLMKGPAGFDVKNREARIYGTGNNPLLWTPLSTIALAAANMVRNPDPIINRPIYICPFLLPDNVISPVTQNAILAGLETVFNTKFSVSNIDIEKINRHAQIALERGEAIKAMKGLTVSNQFYEKDNGNDFSHLVTNELVGVETMSIEEAIKNAIVKWGEDCQVVESMYKVEACEI